MNNKIYDAFDSVQAENSLKQSVKAFAFERIAETKRPIRGRGLAALAVCAALVLLGTGSWRLYAAPVSAISVDVNPSIELGVNRFDKVVSVEGYNEDGTALAAAVSLKNRDYSEALELLLDSEEMQPYIENDGFISITVIGNTEQKSEEMRQRIAACDYATGPNVECQCGNRDEVEKAHDLGLSFGKYRAFLELQALDPELTAEDVQGMTMRQIMNRINELSGTAYAPPYTNGHGNGQHRGGK